MTEQVARRTFIGGALALGAAMATPARAFGTVSALTPYQRRVAASAAREAVRLSSVATHHDIVGVADFGLPSSQMRMHIVDIIGGTVRDWTLDHARLRDQGWS